MGERLPSLSFSSFEGPVPETSGCSLLVTIVYASLASNPHRSGSLSSKPHRKGKVKMRNSLAHLLRTDVSSMSSMTMLPSSPVGSLRLASMMKRLVAWREINCVTHSFVAVPKVSRPFLIISRQYFVKYKFILNEARVKLPPDRPNTGRSVTSRMTRLPRTGPYMLMLMRRQ